MDFYTNIESAFSPMILRRFNTWYSANDGNWSDPNTWMSNALDKKNRTSPQPGDNVYINHIVTADTTVAIGGLYIGGKLISNNGGVTLTVNGSMLCGGVIDFTGSNIVFVLNTPWNQFNTFTAGSSTVQYGCPYDYIIPNLSYYNLTVASSGTTKTQGSNLVIGNTLAVSIGCKYEIGANDLTVTGPTSISSTGATLSKNSSTGTIIFIGVVSSGNNSVWNFSGNANVEFRGGFSVNFNTFTSGTGTYSFTTNNQTISSGGIGIILNGNMSIANSIVVTMLGGGTNALSVYGVINGGNSVSELVVKGALYLYNSTTPMSVGIFTALGNSSSNIGYMFDGNFTIPYATYFGLTVSGTGTKTLGQNTNVSSLTLSRGLGNTTCTIELSTFNFTNTGTTSIGSNGCVLSKNSSTGTTLFTGVVASASNGVINFSGNPDMEFKGGISTNGTNTFGTGTMKLSATQSLNFNTSTTFQNILISGAVTVTSASTTIINGTITGDNVGSIFNNTGTCTYKNATAPMVTGKLYCNQATNTFIYGLSGNQDIQVPSDPTPGYKNLTLNGSGVKTLLGNVSVKGVYTLTGPATLNSNGFALTNP